MKKILLLFISSILILSGCGNQSTVSKPYEIKADSGILSIDDDKTKFEENGFKTFYRGISLSNDNDFAGFVNCNDNCILLDNDAVYMITVYSESIITYKSISPGDDSSKIEDTFENHHKFEHDDGHCSYALFFDKNGKELNDEDIEEAAAYSISYDASNSKIESITICIQKD